MDTECFIGMLNQLTISSEYNYSYSVIELYNKILKSGENDLESLKLSIDDLLIFSKITMHYFFDLSQSINGK